MRKEMKPEMKKVAIIWSSPNKDGLTASAKNEIMRGLIDVGASVEEIHLNGISMTDFQLCFTIQRWGTFAVLGWK